MRNEAVATGNKAGGLKVRDFATIGIFCAIMYVVFIAFSIITGAALFFTVILNAVFVALILAPFYVYMSMRVGKPGIALIYNAIHAVMAGLMMGPFMIPWFLGGGILAELSMLGKGSYRKIGRVSISWIITALTRATHGMACIWFFMDAYIAAGTSPEAAAYQAQYYLSPMWVVVSCGLTVVSAVLGCLLANRLMRKHFQKSGLVA